MEGEMERKRKDRVHLKEANGEEMEARGREKEKIKVKKGEVEDGRTERGERKEE